MIFLTDRIGRLLQEIQPFIYPKSVDIEDYRMLKTTERFTDIAHLDTSSWENFNHEQIWGGHREYYWFDTTVTIPQEFDGECVVFELITGREEAWDATNPQFTVYINGKLIQGMDTNHHTVLVTEQAKAGEQYRIVMSAFTGDQNFSLMLKSQLRVLDRETEKYFYDISVPYHVAILLDHNSKDYCDIVTALNESLNLLDLREGLCDAYYDSLPKAQEYITREFYEKKCGNYKEEIYCVGHTHIDVAWMWTLAVTEDKAVRSFSTVLELMREYPEYIFMSSQPQLYKYVKKHAPEVYEEIKQRVNEGRWEAEGGMFLEADCNIVSGESLVRQFLYGKRFFMQEFNKDNHILWLPDVFGYSAALPQIMQKCGLPYFMTTKISWSEFNQMPYDTFLWEGIDGTKVLTHFIPTRNYNEAPKQGSPETSWFTTYNGMLCPTQVMGGWQRYQEKYLNEEALFSFGHGDGGGGPTKEMLENYRRMEKAIPGCPKTTMSTSEHFFHVLEDKVKDNKYLPTWTGELYLEYHRGTYTSMGRNKRSNRKSEFASQNAELYAVLDRTLNEVIYPQEAINEGWEVIMRNQFHDILPGSSIKEVYDDSKVEYDNLEQATSKLIHASLKSLTANINAPKNSVVVYNPNGFVNSELVEFTIPEGMKDAAVYDGAEKLDCQKVSDTVVAFEAKDVPAKGYKTFALKEEKSEPKAALTVTDRLLENSFFRITLNEKGQFTSLFDKTANREVLKKGQCGNVLMSYEDKPHNHDAWDVNHYYKEKSWEIDDVTSMEIVEAGALKATLRVDYRYLNSSISQYMTIYRDTPRLDIRHEIDWKQKQIFVRQLFPVDIHANEATYEIQYGNVKRPTHMNTSWDFAKFEVCVHKWLDVSEDNFGLSVLNDCKYGCDVHNGVIGMSLLKSATYPNPEADKEHHTFTISLYPHKGDWKAAKTVQQAYSLNNPMTAVVKENQGGNQQGEYSFVSCDCDNVVVEVVKKAEDSDALIVRMYECYNRRTDAALTFGSEVAEVKECDMMEQDLSNIELSGNSVSFEMLPYEIKTVKVILK